MADIRYFYKDTTSGVFLIDGNAIPGGKYNMLFYSSDTVIEVVDITNNQVILGPIEIVNLRKENDTAYTNKADLLTDVADLFESGGGSGGGTAATTSSVATDNITSTNVQADKEQIDIKLLGYTATASAASTTVLDVNSTKIQRLTGTTTHIFQMPVVSTLTLGRLFEFQNDSTGILTINSSGGNTITTLVAGETKIIECISLSGTDATSWKVVEFGGGVGNTIISRDNTFSTNLDFTIDNADEIHFERTTLSGETNLVLATPSTKSDVLLKGSFITDGSIINFPENFSEINNNYASDSAIYGWMAYFDGIDYMFSIYFIKSLDVAAPVLESAILNEGTLDELELTFDEPVIISTSGWSISTDGSALSISSVLSGNYTSIPKFQLSRDVEPGETVTISYDSTTGNTVDLFNNELEDITDYSVTINDEIDLVAELGASLLRWYKDSRVAANRIDDNTGTPSCNQWIDSSGNSSNLVQATKANQPALISDGIKFDGSNDFMDNTISLGNCEVFLLHKMGATSGGNARVYAMTGTNRVILREASTTSLELYSYASSSYISSGTLSATLFNILRTRINTTDSAFNYNTGSFGANAMAATKFTIGDESGGGRPSLCCLTEIVITSILSEPQRTKVIQRLTQVANA